MFLSICSRSEQIGKTIAGVLLLESIVYVKRIVCDTFMVQ